MLLEILKHRLELIFVTGQVQIALDLKSQQMAVIYGRQIATQVLRTLTTTLPSLVTRSGTQEMMDPVVVWMLIR